MIADGTEVKAQPRVIFFDAAGTLIRLQKPVGESYAEIAMRFGAETDAHRMERNFRAVWKEQAPRPPTAVARPADDREWWRSLAAEVLRRSAIIPSSFDHEAWFADLHAYFARAEAWVLFDDVIGTLSLLENRVRLAVLSNFDGRLRLILEGLGISRFFEKMFISSELGCEKPDPEIFRKALAGMKASPGECWHVGDDPEKDGRGARSSGLTPFAVDRPLRPLTGVAVQCIKILEAQKS